MPDWALPASDTRGTCIIPTMQAGRPENGAVWRSIDDYYRQIALNDFNKGDYTL